MAVEPDIYRRLDLDFYDPRVESLTPAEQDLLLATAACPYPPLRSSDIHGRSGKSEGNVNVLMGRLTEQGVLFRVQMGKYDYTAPKFHDYLLRRAQRTAGGSTEATSTALEAPRSPRRLTGRHTRHLP